MIYINRWNYIQEVRTASDFNTKVNTEIRLIIFFAAKDGEALYSHQKKKKDWELTVAHIMNGLLPNSDWSWRRWGKPLAHSGIERLLLNHTTTPGFLTPGGEEFNPGPGTRLDRSELLCNKVLLKYKGDRESFWHRHQKGAERVPAASVNNEVI